MKFKQYLQFKANYTSNEKTILVSKPRQQSQKFHNFFFDFLLIRPIAVQCTNSVL